MAAEKVEGSEPVLPECLDIFSIPATQAGVRKESWVEYRPVSQISYESPIDFTISGAGSQYIDLRKTMLRVKVKIVDDDGKNIDPTNLTAFSNNILHTLFSQIELTIGNKMVSNSGVLYPYKAYFDTLLEFGSDSKRTHLQAQGFYPDTPTKFDETHPLTGGNAGLTERFDLSIGSREFDLIGPLALDLAQQNRLIINGVGIKLKLYQSKPAFVLMSHPVEDVIPRYKVSITDIVLKVCQVSVSPSVLVAHAETLASTPAVYPFYKSELKTESVTAGKWQHTLDNIFLGQIPDLVTIGFISSDAFNGSYTKSPFNMQVNPISSLSLTVDNVSVPGQALRIENGQYIDAFQQLYSALGLFNEDLSIGINRGDWAGGYGVFCFELTPYQYDKKTFSLKQSGNVKLNVVWGSALTENMNIVIYSKSPSIMTIDNARSVIAGA